MGRPSSAAPRNMREKKARACSSRSASIESPAPFLSLQAFLSNAFYGIFIQDDDEIAELILERNWSRNVAENNNGTPLNFKEFEKFLTQNRREFSNRQLISQSFVVAAADGEGETGQVAHNVRFSAIQQGKEVKGNIVAILKIGLEKGARKVETESFVLALDS